MSLYNSNYCACIIEPYLFVVIATVITIQDRLIIHKIRYKLHVLVTILRLNVVAGKNFDRILYKTVMLIWLIFS